MPKALTKRKEKIENVEFLTDENLIHKTLGISWNPRSDKFLFTGNPIQMKDKITKRIIFSEI